ncbi:MAG: DUF421 domain-containing protein [Clostridia bacterium]|nr:DUF421 domain-containing protein [Clostridia bacterium]
MQGFFEIVIRASVAVVFLFVLAKAMGAKQISQLNFYDYIVGITLGSIAATLSLDEKINILYSLIAMSIFALSDIVISFIVRKSIKGRRLFTGEPVMLIIKGQIVCEGLKKARFNINDLLRELRVLGYYNIADLEYVVLETNGMVSLMPKEDKRPVVAEDINAQKTPPGLCSNVVIDGKILIDNLTTMGKDEKWLDKELLRQGYKRYDEILLATLNESGELSIYRKNKEFHKRTVFQ